MHTSIFYKNHHKYMDSKQLNEYINRVVTKSEQEIKTDIRYFEIDLNNHLIMNEQLNHQEMYIYYFIISLLSQDEEATSDYIAEVLEVEIDLINEIADKLEQLEYIENEKTKENN